MKIFIMRHGEAANAAGEDSLRPLTKHGAYEAQKMGHWLADSKLAMVGVFVSPFVRAQQTCTHITEALSKASLLVNTEITTLDFITPSGKAPQLHDYIDGLLQGGFDMTQEQGVSDNQGIMFVSHMPFVSYLVGELTGSSNMPIFATGAIAVIDYDVKQMHGQFVTMISPQDI